ncbi:MAG: PEP-CTERM sorting domain-containing protein [Planctomycetota bacterium]|nr:MAG: PEP-CTERM sorting domain-containing protein [Planctomycetota bacterium]
MTAGIPHGMRQACLSLLIAVLVPLAVRGEDRSYDGSGNNLGNPTLGQVGTHFMRVAPADYGDGISTPAGSTRPGAREISNIVADQGGASMPNTANLSTWVFQWGQFIDHDLTLTTLATPVEMMNIPIPAGDAIFDPGNTGTATMPFRRSVYDSSTGLGPGNPREQFNSISSYLDASAVYGSDQARADALRTMSGGRMKTSAGDLLPFNTDNLPNDDNGDPNRSAYYVAGDVRANEQTGLTAVHTLFVREHNRLADQLSVDNPTWTDEQIYQQARRLVGAQIQSITYREFLPALLGSDSPGIASTYSSSVDPSVSNEFAASLYRVGHTMLPPELARVQNDGTTAPGGNVALRDAFFQQGNLPTSDDLEYMLKGLASQMQQQVDSHIVDDVRNFLFGAPFPGAGFDLAALNIQRGRDHGLPDYNTLRVAYGLDPVIDFSDITANLSLAEALELAYGDVNNIDAWVGALAEDHLGDSCVGPLVEAALIDQFTRTRDGDRFWFTRDENISAEELAWLETVRLSDIIRLNTGITNLQANVFLIPEPSTLVLAAIGLGVMALWRRRRRR